MFPEEPNTAVNSEHIVFVDTLLAEPLTVAVFCEDGGSKLMDAMYFSVHLVLQEIATVSM